MDWCSVARYLRRILRVITTEVLLRVLVSGGRLLVKLRVEIITKLLAQASKGVFSLLRRSSGGSAQTGWHEARTRIGRSRTGWQ